MKKILLLMFLWISFTIKAQVGIGTNTPKSTLDINGSVSQKVTTITTSSTLDIGNAIVLCNNLTLITVTLPTANLIAGRVYNIKSINNGTVLISPSAGQTIDGSASAFLLQYDGVQLITDGTNWYILNKKYDTHYIGENYGGGIIFYLDPSGKHGLIAADSDQSTGVKWNNTGAGAGEYFYAQLQGIYTGKDNTSFIIYFNPGIYAASICDALVLNTYTDWYLPSIEELNMMYRNLYMQGLGNFSGSSYYWSSTAHQITNEGAYAKYFPTGEQIVGDISDLNRIRACRSF